MISVPRHRRTDLLSKTFAAAIVVAAATTAIFVSALLYWSTLQVDEVTLTREMQIVKTVLGERSDAIAYEQESVTVWDDTVQHLRGSDLDYEWLDGNVGVWLHSYFGHDDVFVLDGQDQPIYVMEEGERRNPARYALVAAAIDPIVQDLRRKQLSKEPPAEKALSTGASDFVVVKDRPAIVSAKPVVSDSGTIEQEPGSEAVHVSVRFLDGSFLPNLFRKYLIVGGRFAWTNDLVGDERSHPFLSRAGKVVGYFVWEPYQPGSIVLGQLAPVLAGAVLLDRYVTGCC